MAKFKVGDNVKQVEGPGKGITGQIVNIYPLTDKMTSAMGFENFVGHDMVTFFGPSGKSIVPEDWLILANSCRSRNAIVAKALNACGTARNAGAYDVAGEAGKLFKDAYNDLAGCAAKLERLTTLGQPDDVPGNNNKIATWAKDKARKVRDIMNKLDQGRL